MSSSNCSEPAPGSLPQAGKAETPASAWLPILRAYRTPSTTRSIAELAATAVPLAAIWIVAWFAHASGYWWLALLLAIPASVFLVRLFMIQHDCGHGAFFGNRHANDWIGRIIGVFTMTPYAYWRSCHAIHHSTCGNLAKRGIGDINTLTVREYRARGFWGRLQYRLYRHPLVLFGIGPLFQFGLAHRLPLGLMREGWRPWLSTQGTNIAIASVMGGLVWLIGLPALLNLYLPVMLLAAAIGVWLFYLQHQFEDTIWRQDGEWSFHEASLYGSSYYALPPVLQWLSANIGLHHVHHLMSRIPYYRLPKVLADHPELANVSRLTLRSGFRTVALTLWDEDRQKLVSFREAHAP